ncbi:MAG: endonuclease V [Candidatus Aenigmarchaeota archaeon]|nr:endonuclease V [Candidatus Aenigmarchaeota archaeon]
MKTKFFQELQKALSRLVEFKKIEKMENVLALDVAYKDDLAFCGAVIYNLVQDKIVKEMIIKDTIDFPYIPGLLFLREAPIMLEAIREIDRDYDLILVDGHGLAHPRKAGLATIIGILTGKPTIGIAKSFLHGDIKNGYIIVGGQKVGIKFGRYYASIGSNIDIESLERFIKMINFKYPKPLKIADKLSKTSILNFVKKRR